MPHSSVTSLNRQLAEKGEDVVYVSQDFYGNGATVNTRAFVRGYRPEELVGGITFDNSLAIVTPSDLAAAGVEPQKGDTLIIGGKHRAVQALGVFRIDGEIVRYEMQVA